VDLAIWSCERPFSKPTFYGTYPQGFLSKALGLFPQAKDIVHCPSGSLTGPGITIDAVRDEQRCPQIVADAKAIPLPDNSCDLFLSDPPYEESDSRQYGCSKFPLQEMMLEAYRLVRPKGHFGILHLYTPAYIPAHWELVKQVAIVLGVGYKLRMFSVFKSRKVVA
jgi:hypothetical protein